MGLYLMAAKLLSSDGVYSTPAGCGHPVGALHPQGEEVHKHRTYRADPEIAAHLRRGVQQPDGNPPPLQPLLLA